MKKILQKPSKKVFGKAYLYSSGENGTNANCSGSGTNTNCSGSGTNIKC